METCKGLGSLSSPSVSFLSLPQNIFSSTILRDGTFYFNIVTSLFFPLLLHPPPNKHPLSLTEFEYRYASHQGLWENMGLVSTGRNSALTWLCCTWKVESSVAYGSRMRHQEAGGKTTSQHQPPCSS